MPKAFGLVVSFTISMVLIQIVADVLQLRAIRLQRVDWAPTQIAPSGPVHELEREASAGAMFT
jgi:hypothetical protein